MAIAQSVPQEDPQQDRLGSSLYRDGDRRRSERDLERERETHTKTKKADQNMHTGVNGHVQSGFVSVCVRCRVWCLCFSYLEDDCVCFRMLGFDYLGLRFCSIGLVDSEP